MGFINVWIYDMITFWHLRFCSFHGNGGAWWERKGGAEVSLRHNI